MISFKRRHLLFFPVLLLLALVGCGGGDTDSTRPLNTGPYTVGGTVTAVAGNAVDSDVNDPAAPYASNDDDLSAQALPNPVVLGGYLTAVATGVAGDRCATIIDEEDWFSMTLVAGQTITLTIADHDGNVDNPVNPDLDLYLKEPVNLGDAQPPQLSLNRQEAIKVTTSGDYFVMVSSFAGSSNYTLSVGMVPAALGSAALNVEDDFVPGEVIVRFREATPAAGIAAQGVNDRTALPGLTPRAGRAGEPMLYRLNSPDPKIQAMSRSAAGVTALERDKLATVETVKALRQRADVASADLNYIRRGTLTPDDSLFAQQWNASMINLPLAWDLTTGSASVVVAAIDTGVLMNHPDLVGRLCTSTDNCRGYDFVADVTRATDGTGIDNDPNDPGDSSSILFHGTRVAGIVGAAGNNATGVAGVDWNARIMPVRVLGVGGGTSYDLIQGIRYAAGLSNDSATVPVQRANILNLSLGGGGYSQTEQDLFTAVRNLGIIVVAAAGNEGNNIPFYPAAYAGVVAVSAVNETKDLADYSSYGATVDVAAPGGLSTTGIMSTSGTNSSTYTYASLAGTSMAAPHVAGVAALMLAKDSTLTPAEFDILLAAGSLTEDLGEGGVADGPAYRNNSFGYGLIDAEKAVTAAQNLAAGGALPPALSSSPSVLDFGSSAITLPLTLTNAGGGTLTVTTASASAPWLSIDSTGVPFGGLGVYTVNVDRTHPALTVETIYSATITITTSIPSSYVVPVLLRVGTGGVANAGQQTIYLLDAASGAQLQSLRVAADPAAGTYPYSFTGVVPGNYLIMAGSDLDRDGQICDAGEACGGYPLLTDPAVIPVTTSDLGGINFSTGFDANR